MSTEPAAVGGTGLSESFLLGILKAALRPSRIDLEEVKKVLRTISLSGFDPVKLYQEAVADRPEAFDPPPLLANLLPRHLPKEKQLDLQLGEILSKKQPPDLPSGESKE